MTAIERFKQVAGKEKFQGWPLVGEYQLGEKVPFFGQALHYQLRTGNGVEDYTSLIRHFGWCVVFGVNTEGNVITLVQWKPGVNKASWELPPGGIGKIAPGTGRDEILAATQSIYLKETGYGEGKWSYLGHILIETGKYRGAGPNDHGLPAHMMLATDLTKTRNGREPNRNEIMETLEFPLGEIREVIESGLLDEASALPCALLACTKLGKLAWT